MHNNKTNDENNSVITNMTTKNKITLDIFSKYIKNNNKLIPFKIKNLDTQPEVSTSGFFKQPSSSLSAQQSNSLTSGKTKFLPPISKE